MEIKTYTNKKAKKLIRKIINTQIEQLKEQSLMFLCDWLSFENDIICYTICEQNIIKHIVLLSKIDFDPFGKHSNPYLINYIYTFPEYRRFGYASKMLSYIKSKNETTAICNGDKSIDLFKKSGFKNFDEIKQIYRFP